MEKIDPGHIYKLDQLDVETVCASVLLTFVKREGPGYPGNVGHYPGTTVQEVLRACIDRIKYVDAQIHHDNNDRVISHLRETILLLEERAAERHNKQLIANVYDKPIENATVKDDGHLLWRDDEDL